MILKRKQNLELVTGIDIGSSAIRVVVGQSDTKDKKRQAIQILAAIEVPSDGVHKGVITSIEECVSSVSNVLEKTERTIGCPIDHLWVGVSGTDIISQESKGVVAVAKTDGEHEYLCAKCGRSQFAWEPGDAKSESAWFYPANYSAGRSWKYIIIQQHRR